MSSGNGWWGESDGSAGTLRSECDWASVASTLVTHALTGEGFDASEDGTGRGTPLVPAVAGCLEATSHDWSRSDPSAFTPIGFYPTGGTHGVSAVSDGMPSLKIGTKTGGNAPAIAFHSTQDPIHSTDSFPCLGTGSSEGAATLAVCSFDWQKGNDRNNPRPSTMNVEREGVGALQAQKVPAVFSPVMSVRRLSCRECERLQGFPDDYTLIPGAKDGPRYRALGNSMAVPVMAWIGKRIDMIERMTSPRAALGGGE